MRYTRSKGAEKAFLKEDRYVSSWEVAEKKYQSKLKKKKRKGKRKN
ncbi:MULTISPECIES: hypothetical protein [Bacillus cereus group]|nr:hypothetical protein [Bacillus cereus group sp. TH260-2LC]MDA1532128.1 hypothetical protein [Bacillus cereus group sp. TH260-2LC]